MKFVSSYAHGFTDYVIGIILLLAPNLFGFADLGGAPVVVARVVGALILLQALMTRYELGLVKALPLRTHLWGDYILGIFLAISPWLFAFHTQPGNVWLPHLLTGIVVFLLALVTEPFPRRLHADVPVNPNP